MEEVVHLNRQTNGPSCIQKRMHMDDDTASQQAIKLPHATK